MSLWAGTITYFSSLTGPEIQQIGLTFWDKAQHAAGFATLAYVGLRAYAGQVRVLVIGLLLFGAGIEVAQWLSGWRMGDWQDWLADCVGLLAGYWAWRLALVLRSGRRTS